MSCHAVIEQEAVLSALGGTLSDEDLLPRSKTNILAAMKRHGARRLIVLGAAGAVESTLRRMPAVSQTVFRVVIGRCCGSLSSLSAPCSPFAPATPTGPWYSLPDW